MSADPVPIQDLSKRYQIGAMLTGEIIGSFDDDESALAFMQALPLPPWGYFFRDRDEHKGLVPRRTQFRSRPK